MYRIIAPPKTLPRMFPSVGIMILTVVISDAATGLPPARPGAIYARISEDSLDNAGPVWTKRCGDSGEEMRPFSTCAPPQEAGGGQGRPAPKKGFCSAVRGKHA